MTTIIKQQIADSIHAFSKGSLTENSLNLFKTLGYNTDRQGSFSKKTYQYFRDSFVDGNNGFKEDKALINQWSYVDLLFQLSEEEMKKQVSLFDAKEVITSGDSKIAMESYLFFVIGLSGSGYSRTDLSRITREVNRLFPMPAMILFEYD